MADVDYPELLNFAKAKVVTEGKPGQTNDGELTLMWEGISSVWAEGALDWAKSNRLSISDQKVEYKTFDGTWRSVDIAIQPSKDARQSYNLVHRFAKGYIQTLVSAGALVWTESRLEEVRSKPNDTGGSVSNGVEEYLVAHWINVDPKKVNAIVDEIEALDDDAFAPTIKTETYGTAWHRLAVIGKIDDDGSGTITLFLAHPEYLLYGFQNWLGRRQESVQYHFNVPKQLAQAVLDAWKAVGRSATASYGAKEGLADLVLRDANFGGTSLTTQLTLDNKDGEEYTDFYWSVANPDLYQVEDHANYDEVGYSIVKSLQMTTDGLYDITLRADKSLARNHSFVAGRTALKTSSEVLYKNTLLANFGSAPEVSGSGIYRINKVMEDDGTYSGNVVYDVGTNTGYARFNSEKSVLANADAWTYRNINTYLNAPASAVGRIYKANNSINEDGTYDSNLVYDQSTPATINFTSGISQLKDVYTYTYRNRTSPVGRPSRPGAGGAYRISQNVNTDGTYDAQVVYEQGTSTGNTTFGSLYSPTGYEITQIYKNASTKAAVPGDTTQTYTYRANNSINDDGTYDSRWEVSKSIPMAIATQFNDTSGLVDVYTYKNQLAPPTVQVGVNTSLHTSINTDGTYDAVMTLRDWPFDDVWKDGGGKQDYTFYTKSLNSKGEYLFYKQIDVYTSNSLSGAEAFMTNAASGTSTNAKMIQGSGIRYSGNGRWIATRVTKV